MLLILALGMLIAVGAAFDEMGHGPAPDGGDHHGNPGDHDNYDFGGHEYHDWLSPGGIYSYSYWYPYTYTYTYPTYYYPTYYYPTYYYTEPAPVVYPTYTYYPSYSYYYDPVVYDPWYAANVYGWGGATYYYSSSWSWSNHGGYYF